MHTLLNFVFKHNTYDIIAVNQMTPAFQTYIQTHKIRCRAVSTNNFTFFCFFASKAETDGINNVKCVYA